MLQGSVLAGGYADVEVLLHFGQLGEGGSGELPVFEGFVNIVAGVGCAIAAKDFGSVVGGIEADTEEVRVLVERGVGLEGLVDGGEVAAHAGTVIRERAAGVDEGHEDDLAVKLLEIDLVAGLIEQGEVWNYVALGGDVVVDGGLVVWAALGDDHDFSEAQIFGAGGIMVGEERGGDGVAGMQFGKSGGIFEAIGHGHGGHETRDVVVLEENLGIGGVCADDSSTDGILLCGCAQGGRVCGAVATDRGDGQGGHRQEQYHR